MTLGMFKKKRRVTKTMILMLVIAGSIEHSNIRSTIDLLDDELRA